MSELSNHDYIIMIIKCCPKTRSSSTCVITLQDDISLLAMLNDVWMLHWQLANGDFNGDSSGTFVCLFYKKIIISSNVFVCDHNKHCFCFCFFCTLGPIIGLQTTTLTFDASQIYKLSVSANIIIIALCVLCNASLIVISIINFLQG